MIRIVLTIIVALALPFAAWKLWRLFGPAGEIRLPPRPPDQPSEIPVLALLAAGMVLVVIVLGYFILSDIGGTESTYTLPQAPDWARPDQR